MAAFRRLPASQALVLGLAFCLSGLGATAYVAVAEQHKVNELAQLRFTQSADSFAQALTRRLDSYIEIAFGLRGLFIANPALGRRDFMDAVGRLDVGTRHPEIKNLAFTRYVRAQDKAAFEQHVRADTSVTPEGYPQFAIRPPGMRQEYFVADYLWPMQGNQGVHGLDISAQPANLASMRYSQTSGKPVASGPFDLLQESQHRTGFVIRVPVFRSHAGASAQAPQSTDFLGAVAVTLRMWDVMERLRTEGRLQGLSLYLSDRGPDYAPQDFAVNLPLFVSAAPEDSAHAPAYQHELAVFGRKWQLDINPAQAFLSPAEQRAPWWFAIGGSVLSLLLGFAVSSLARAPAVPQAPATGPDTP